MEGNIIRYLGQQVHFLIIFNLTMVYPVVCPNPRVSTLLIDKPHNLEKMQEHFACMKCIIIPTQNRKYSDYLDSSRGNLVVQQKMMESFK